MHELNDRSAPTAQYWMASWDILQCSWPVCDHITLAMTVHWVSNWILICLVNVPAMLCAWRSIGLRSESQFMVVAGKYDNSCLRHMSQSSSIIVVNDDTHTATVLKSCKYLSHKPFANCPIQIAVISLPTSNTSLTAWDNVRSVCSTRQTIPLRTIWEKRISSLSFFFLNELS